jgi:hypothetical protein
MAWVKNSRHILPIGRCESHKTFGGLCRDHRSLHAGNGITIAQVSTDEKPEEEPHDDI